MTGEIGLLITEERHDYWQGEATRLVEEMECSLEGQNGRISLCGVRSYWVMVASDPVQHYVQGGTSACTVCIKGIAPANVWQVGMSHTKFSSPMDTILHNNQATHAVNIVGE